MIAHRLSPAVTLQVGFASLLRDGLALLWREDPQIAAVVTPPFLKEFKAEFDRMVRERCEGADQSDQQAHVLSLMHADSWDSRHRLFDVLVKQYHRIDELSPLLRAEVIMKLMQHCHLPGAGLI
jgi:hypothetical protein